MIAALGWAGSALCVWSLTQKDPGRFRALNLGACIALIIVDTAIAAWSMAVLNLVVAGINIHSLIGLRKAARLASANADVPVEITLDDLDPAEARALVGV